MKKYIKFAFVAAVVAASGYNIYQSQSVMSGMSEFALANVEALASDEDGGGYDSECQLYPEFAFVGKTYGKEEERIHKDRYYDLLVTYNVEYCTASGCGSLRGSNSMISSTIENTVEVTCNH